MINLVISNVGFDRNFVKDRYCDHPQNTHFERNFDSDRNCHCLKHLNRESNFDRDIRCLKNVDFYKKLRLRQKCFYQRLLN
eukprot:UN14449